VNDESFILNCITLSDNRKSNFKNNKTSSSAEIQPMDKVVLTKISTLENKEVNL